MRYFFTTLLISISFASMAQSPEINFTTKNGSDKEKAVIPKMQQLLKQYDLSKWIFTREVIIEQYAIPHSHPVLTLNTRPVREEEMLSTFIHEQLHWYVADRPEKEKKAIAELRKKYPEVPFGNREGAKDEYSTYLHLIVCYLEYKSMVALVGQPAAEKVMRETNHYTWIYKTVLEDEQYIGGVIASTGLNLVD
jgi:hypothetical protein